VLKQSAEKDLDSIGKPYIVNIINKIEELKYNPRNEKVKKLVGRNSEYRLRIGNYRVLFYIDDLEKVIKISRILHRKDAYKN
jgi:mRNA interferase RelE/StbE